MFSCLAEGRPRPNITWLRREGDSDRLEQLTGLFSNVAIGEDSLASNLTVPDSGPAIAGEYICRAENGVEEVTETSANLTVNGVCVYVCVCVYLAGYSTNE